MKRSMEAMEYVRQIAEQDGDVLLGVYAEAYLLQAKKARDYQGGGVSRDAYFPFGLKSYVHMLVTKALRLVSLANQDTQPVHESIEDSGIDLINYAAFMVERQRRDNVPRP